MVCRRDTYVTNRIGCDYKIAIERVVTHLQLSKTNNIETFGCRCRLPYFHFRYFLRLHLYQPMDVLFRSSVSSCRRVLLER